MVHYWKKYFWFVLGLNHRLFNDSLFQKDFFLTFFCHCSITAINNSYCAALDEQSQVEPLTCWYSCSVVYELQFQGQHGRYRNILLQPSMCCLISACKCRCPASVGWVCRAFQRVTAVCNGVVPWTSLISLHPFKFSSWHTALTCSTQRSQPLMVI